MPNRPLLSSDAEITENDRLKRVRDEEIALTRSIGIVTTQSALLVASLSETATRFPQQFAETTQKSEEATRTSLRTVLVTVLIVGVFAVIAASAAIFSYVEERENRQIRNQWQESVLRSMKETAAAQEAQIRKLPARLKRRSSAKRQNPPRPSEEANAKPAADRYRAATTRAAALKSYTHSAVRRRLANDRAALTAAWSERHRRGVRVERDVRLRGRPDGMGVGHSSS
jgi:hypothetical protein